MQRCSYHCTLCHSLFAVPTSYFPRFGFCLPAKIFKAVDFPIPLVPTNPRTSPGRGIGNLNATENRHRAKSKTWYIHSYKSFHLSKQRIYQWNWNAKQQSQRLFAIYPQEHEWIPYIAGMASILLKLTPQNTLSWSRLVSLKLHLKCNNSQTLIIPTEWWGHSCQYRVQFYPSVETWKESNFPVYWKKRWSSFLAVAKQKAFYEQTQFCWPITWKSIA